MLGATIPKVLAPWAPEHILEPLQQWLEHTSQGGQPFEDGQEFQFGFIRFRVERTARGGQRVTAPTIGKSALLHGDDCTDALRLIASQQAVLQRYDLEGAPCTCRQTALVVRDIDSCKELFIDRLASELEDRSGWYIGAHDTTLDVCDPRNLKLIGLWDVVGRNREISPYLLLPPGHQVSFSGPKPVVMRDRMPLEPVGPRPGVAGAA